MKSQFLIKLLKKRTTFPEHLQHATPCMPARMYQLKSDYGTRSRGPSYYSMIMQSEQKSVCPLCPYFETPSSLHPGR